MAEICQILLVTLLLYLFWLPSGGSVQVDSDGNSTGVLAHPKTEGQGKRDGTNVRRQGIAVDPDDDPPGPGGEEPRYPPRTIRPENGRPVPQPPSGVTVTVDWHPDDFSSGEDYIIKLLSAYMILGCKAASNLSVESTDGMRFDPGEHVMIQILSTYFKFDCKGGPSSFSKPAGSDDPYDADTVIIHLLLAFYEDGCRGAVAAIRLSTIHIPASELVLTDAKGFILRLLLTFLNNECKGGTEKAVEGIGQSSDAGHHVQSVVLELFLLIFGMSLTRMEL